MKKELSRVYNILKKDISKVINQSKGNVEFHNNLRKYLSMIAVEFDYTGKTKYKIDSKKHIDVVWLDDLENVRWAFEIDGGQRKRSIKRLSDMVADNKIWIYYGNPNKLGDFIKQTDPSNSFLLLNLGNIRKELRKEVKLTNKISSRVTK
ncbi:hypothetical protein [Peribacillus asahii]|uniref:hypothetical protein n=1 Tax=Peribacillus asahii TaxID=228899 RepID=UPI00207A10F7|nr:hypothetical protein [Peribacillus asahii]USK71251.1 hypothetical protein LIS76_05665 [Peribacillus asahii]